MTKQQLLNGETFSFDNERHETLFGSDHVSHAEVFFCDSPGWAAGFTIEFNGSIIASRKTFKSFQKRLDELIEKWNLEPSINN